MKIVLIQALIIGLVVFGFISLVSGCATRVAKEDCLASFSVSQLIKGEELDWAKVQHWNCKK
jgi:uncharacterized protein YceK